MSARRCASGFTLVELLVALTLLALLSAVLSGSLRLAGRSWQGGEARAAQVDEMRQTQAFLREQIASALPKRMAKAVDTPLLFQGDASEIYYVAPLPERVVEGGTQLFHLAVEKDGERNALVLERVYIDPDLLDLPDFRDSERTVLAEHIAEIKLGYFGRDPDASDSDTPKWRDRWDDRQRLPMLIRIDVQPERGPAWPTLIAEPRRAPEAACRAWDPTRRRCVRV
ncbi:MAG TPA: prepilin-type N-terminal cleavage/methylation domain-containing protein [Casimicrobiaceae bacterium]|nr:prepilin-type N-terminal cleavage/methylation domain-containing protein [Casimicrobiaceae bacterium]